MEDNLAEVEAMQQKYAIILDEELRRKKGIKLQTHRFGPAYLLFNHTIRLESASQDIFGDRIRQVSPPSNHLILSVYNTATVLFSIT